MKQIRKGLFETNSSSTHAIVVSLKRDTVFKLRDLYTSWDTYDFCFSRESYRLLEGWDNKLAYVYIVIQKIQRLNNVVYPKIDIIEFKSKVLKVWREVLDEIKTRKNATDSGYFVDECDPEKLFKVLDFIEARRNIPDLKPTFDFDTYKFDNILQEEPYVDHSCYFYIQKDDDRRFAGPCSELLEKLQDEEYLKYFLFSDDSYITIGGDEYRGYNLKTLGFEYDYEDKSLWKERVEEYKKTHDVYFKGN